MSLKACFSLLTTFEDCFCPASLSKSLQSILMLLITLAPTTIQNYHFMTKYSGDKGASTSDLLQTLLIVAWHNLHYYIYLYPEHYFHVLSSKISLKHSKTFNNK